MPIESKAPGVDDVHGQLIKNFDDALEATEDARDEAEQSRDYYDGIQWTSEEVAELTKRKQPPITDNRLKDKIEYVIGLELTSRTDPKAYPRTPEHESSAEAATDSLRFVADNNDFDATRSDVFEDMLVEGYGGAEIYVVQKEGAEDEIKVKRNRWDRCYYDPHSSLKDFSDATFLGTFVWMDVEIAEDMYPDHDWETAANDMRVQGDSDDDKPKDNYVDYGRRRVRIIEQYFLKDGSWHRAKFTKWGWLDKPAESAYQNEDGDPEHPYCWMSCYVGRDNDRYGLVRRYKSLQDEINHRKSRALFLLNTNQIFAQEGAFDDPQKARREAARPDGVVLYNSAHEARIEKNTDLSAGHMGMMQAAMDSLSVTGPRAVQSTGSSQSGRAKQLDQQTDVLELGRLLDQLKTFQRDTYRKVWNRVKNHWTDEKWVRVRDNEHRMKFVGLNERVTARQMAEEQGIPVEMLMQDGIDPNTSWTRNEVAELDVDIVIDDMPDVTTLQQEQFANLVSLAQAGVVFPPETYIEASSLRNKDQLQEKLTGGDDPEARQAAQQQRRCSSRLRWPRSRRWWRRQKRIRRRPRETAPRPSRRRSRT